MTRPSDIRGATPRPAHSVHEALAKGLGAFSIALGLVEIFGARRLTGALGLEGRETLVRAFGVREVATGIAILGSHDPTPWIWGRVAGDALDLATLAAGFDGDERQRTRLGIAAAAVAGVTALDLVCAQGLTADKRLAKPGTYDYSARSGFPRSVDSMRGAARDAVIPDDFRIPGPLRPWTDERARTAGAASA